MKRDLTELPDRIFDVLVVGGGIHGALAAWDATLRGLSVALIERGDFGSGTSQNSLKTIHGGLRYLQDANLARIRTMARERTTWMKIAPHLIHPLTCLMPTRQKFLRSRSTMRAALLANDILSFDRNRLTDPEKFLAGGSIISQRQLAERLPGYDVSTSDGAAVWHDAQVFNTERLLLEFIISAADAGAAVANYVEATQLLTGGKQINGVQATDVHTGDVLDIRAKVVINCAGAWIDHLLETTSLCSEYATSIAMNVIIDQVWTHVAAGLPSKPTDGRKSQILFFVPWRDKTMIGTWHIPWNESPNAFKLSVSMLQRFLDEINSAHPALKLTLDDVQHVTWGFLPVNKQDAHQEHVKLTRDGVVTDHQNRDGVAGLISVLGVKYTTARVVAQQAVDMAVGKLGVKAKRCETQNTTVNGGKVEYFDAFRRQAASDARGVIDKQIIEHLVYTYGSEYRRFAKYNLARIDNRFPVTEAEVVHAVRDEMALTLLDVIQRRTELGATGLPPMRTLQRCADVMSRELNWTLEHQQTEIDSVVQAYPIRQMERATV